MSKIHLVYCPACRREVRVAATDPPRLPDGHATIPDPRAVCLDFGDRCEEAGTDPDEPSGAACCPVFRVPPAVMGIQRARAGLSPEPRTMILNRCQGCGVETTQEKAAGAWAVCAICRSTNPLA